MTAHLLGADRAARRACRRACSTSSTASGRRWARRSCRHPDVQRHLLHRRHAHRRGDRPRRRARCSRSSRWSWAARTPTSSSPTPTSTRRWPPRCARRFANQGQICLCGSRIFVRAPASTSASRRRWSSARGRSRWATRWSPAPSRARWCRRRTSTRCWATSTLAREEGGTHPHAAASARSVRGPLPNGWFVEPTVIEGLGPTCRTNQEEIFGPVATLMPFDDEEEVLALANGTRYGLAASCGRRTSRRAHRVAGAAAERHRLGELLDAARPAHAVRRGEGVGRGPRGRLGGAALLHRAQERLRQALQEADRHGEPSRSRSAPPEPVGALPARPARGQPAVPLRRRPARARQQDDPGRRRWTRRATSSRYDIEAQCHSVFAQRARHPRGRGLALGAARRRDGVPHRHEDATSPPTTGSGPSTSRTARPCRTTLEITALPTPIAIELKCIATHRESDRWPRCSPSTSRSGSTSTATCSSRRWATSRSGRTASSSSWWWAGPNTRTRLPHRRGRGVLLPARRRHHAAGAWRTASSRTSRSARAKSSCCRRTCRTRRSGPPNTVGLVIERRRLPQRDGRLPVVLREVQRQAVRGVLPPHQHRHAAAAGVRALLRRREHTHLQGVRHSR